MICRKHKELELLWGVVGRGFDRSSCETETGGPLWMQGQAGLHKEFQDSQDPTVLKKKMELQVTVDVRALLLVGFASWD